MAAGKKLDESVAQYVLEWRKEGDRWIDPSSAKVVTLRPFSTDINAAWILAERICDVGYRLQLDGNRLWQARFYKSMSHTLETKAFSATSGSPAEAICLAALAVKGVAAS